MRRVTGALLAAITSCSLVGCTLQQRINFHLKAEFRQAADVQRVTSTVIETRNGSVDVQCDPAVLEADVSGTKYASALTEAAARDFLERIIIRAERDTAHPEVLRIAAEFPSDPGINAGVHFKILLPSDTAVQIRTSNAQASVTGAARDVRIESSNGQIRAARIGGVVHATTANASIGLEEVAGDVEAISSNGEISLQHVGHGHVHAKTSNGRIRATNLQGVTRLETTYGEVHGAGIQGDVSATTACASITLDDVAGNVEAVSSNGQISLDRVGRGQVHAKSSNGRIRVKNAQGMTRLETTFGALEGAAIQGDVDAHTAGAAITLEDVSGDVNAVTSNGEISLQRVGRSQVLAKSTNGKIRAVHTHGSARLETTYGSVQVSGVEGDVYASTAGASISLEDVAGDVTAISSDGFIDLQRVGRGQVRAKSRNGRIRAIDTCGTVNLETSYGGIELKARSLPPKPEVRLATTGAGVRVQLPATVNAGLRLKATNDRVNTDLKRAEVSGLQTANGSVAAALNGGGGLIDVSTANGTIDFTLVDAPATTQPAVQSQ